MMRLSFRSMVTLSVVLVLTACSDSGGGSSSTVSIKGWVGAQGLDSAQVVPSLVNESGQVSFDTNDIYVGSRESTSSESEFSANVTVEEIYLLIARGQIEDADKDNSNDATQRLCQLALGCTSSGVFYEYKAFYPAVTGFEWRTIVYNPSSGSRNNINAITTLSDSFAYLYDVKSSRTNGVYTVYDIVLANSQISNLFGLGDIVGELPANLTKLNSLKSDSASTKNQVRYGALLGGLQQLELAYQANATGADEEYITKVATELANDEGQLYFHTSVVERELTKEALYLAAYENLQAIIPTITKSGMSALATQVVEDLKAERMAALAEPVDTKTVAVSDDLSTLLAESEIENVDLGIEKTKLFVASLLDYQNTFWTDGYKVEAEVYRDKLTAIADTHKDNLNSLVAEFSRIQDYYVTCIIGGALCDESQSNGGFSDLELRKDGYNSLTKTLTMDGGKLVISQALADLSVTGSSTLTESHAVDVYITGTLEKNNLTLLLKHNLDSDEEEIDVPSSMRIYYSEAVSEARSDLDITGYELMWGDFQLYDQAAVGELTETDLAGAFSIFYRGVRDPQDTDIPNSSELRFNIENFSLSSVISDSVDTDASDSDFSTLFITAKATNADVYYPPKKFSSFNGFFTTNNDHAINDIEPGLLTYTQSTESIQLGSKVIMVNTVDFVNSLGEDVRYRFYPNESVVDEDDGNGNGDVKETITQHRIEKCELVKGTTNVAKCEPKTKVYEGQNVQKVINELWELGVFQLTAVDGRGTYFIDFPTTVDDQGCKVLSPLEDTSILDGRLLEQQVLGLDSVRLVSVISLDNDAGTALAGTLFDLTILAPTATKYEISAALSHNYSSTGEDNSGFIVGTGSSVNVVRIRYDTSADFENTGYVSIVKSGVELTLADGSVEDEDQRLTAFVSQSFDADGTNSITYKLVENEDGDAERCVSSVGSVYDKDVDNTDLLEQVFYLNYRGVVYATVRQESGAWIIRYIDGTWFIPGTGVSG